MSLAHSGDALGAIERGESPAAGSAASQPIAVQGNAALGTTEGSGGGVAPLSQQQRDKELLRTRLEEKQKELEALRRRLLRAGLPPQRTKFVGTPRPPPPLPNLVATPLVVEELDGAQTQLLTEHPSAAPPGALTIPAPEVAATWGLAAHIHARQRLDEGRRRLAELIAARRQRDAAVDGEGRSGGDRVEEGGEEEEEEEEESSDSEEEDEVIQRSEARQEATQELDADVVVVADGPVPSPKLERPPHEQRSTNRPAPSLPQRKRRRTLSVAAGAALSAMASGGVVQVLESDEEADVRPRASARV